jgi:hypothetical protein
MILVTDYFYFDLINAEYPVEPFPLQGNPQNFVMVMPGQSLSSLYYTSSSLNLSILVQGIDGRAALEMANQIYDRYRDQINYEITLPEDYEADVEPRSIICLYIQPIDRPVPLGDVGNGRYQYTVNFIAQLGGQTI